MDERITAFIEDLKKYLKGLPEEEIQEAVSYYEEYFSDALDAGKDLDTILNHLDSPQKIAAMVKTEASIIRTQKNPGLRNYASVLRNAFNIVTTPLTFLLLAVFVIASFSIVVSFFVISLCAFAGALIFFFIIINQAFTAFNQDVMGIVGAIGLGILGAGFLLALSYVFFKLGRLLIRVSVWLVRKMMGKPGRIVPETEREQNTVKRIWSHALPVFAVIMFTGLIMLSVSGLLLKYWMIFNSMKPLGIEVHTMEFDPAQVDKISAVTTHTNIKLVRGSGDKISLSYEQTDWLEYEAELNGREICFNEKSNGRLPLFQLTQLHENSAVLTISIPENFSLQSIDAESYGGIIYIENLVENIEASTMSGKIYLDNKNVKEDCSLRVTAGAGTIEVNGKKEGQETDKGLEFSRNTGDEKTIELTSARGGIFITWPQ